MLNYALVSGILTNFNYPLILIDNEGIIRFANKPTFDYLGCNEEHLVDKPIEILLPKLISDVKPLLSTKRLLTIAEQVKAGTPIVSKVNGAGNKKLYLEEISFIDNSYLLGILLDQEQQQIPANDVLRLITNSFAVIFSYGYIDKSPLVNIQIITEYYIDLFCKQLGSQYGIAVQLIDQPDQRKKIKILHSNNGQSNSDFENKVTHYLNSTNGKAWLETLKENPSLVYEDNKEITKALGGDLGDHIMCLPIIYKEDLLGIIFLLSNKPFRYANDVYNLANLMGIMGIFLHENQRRSDETIFDNITPAYNRLFYQTRLDQIIADNLANGNNLAVTLVNINNFKQINSYYSIIAGDLLLLQFYNRINNFYNGKANIIRMNADEFLIIDKVQDLNSLELLWNYLNGKYKIQNQIIDCKVTIAFLNINNNQVNSFNIHRQLLCSIGFARTTHTPIIEYHPVHEKLLNNKLNIPEYIDSLFAENKFKIFLQPIYSAKLDLVGFETLLRLELDNELVGPGAFLDYLIANGYIDHLNEMVIDKVIVMLASSFWQQNYANQQIMLSINISPLVDNFLEHLDKILAKLDKNKHLFNNINIQFEITENEFNRTNLDNQNFFTEITYKLKRHQIALAMDDFGVGYSSLKRLLEMEFDTIKMDISFAKQLIIDGNISQRSHSIFELMLIFANKINAKLIVEGIETQEQLTMLSKIGYDYFQGNLLGKPFFPAE